MTFHIDLFQMYVALAIVIFVMSTVLGIIYGREVERSRWIQHAERLGSEKKELIIKDLRYIVMRSDEYEQFLNIYPTED